MDLIEQLNAITCPCCNSEVEELGFTVDGQDACSDCDDNSHLCDHCDERSSESTTTVYREDQSDVSYCETCVSDETSQCDDCGETWTNQSLTRVSGGDYVCPSCRNDNYFYCECCEEYIHQNYYGRDGECEDCSSKGLSAYLDDYSDKNHFAHIGKGRTKFGVELEFDEADLDFLNHSKAELSGCIFKSDASVDDGFEICSQPACLNSHRENFKDFFEGLGLQSYSNHYQCGMHVHVSRAGLNKKQIQRMIDFLAAPTAQKFLDNISGRKENSYCLRHLGKSSKAREEASKGHFSALSTRPKHTVEFRLFRTPENFEDFEARLEFVAALVKWAAKFRTRRDYLGSFVEYVKKSNSPNWKAVESRLP